ncbi:hypothetical protein [Pseudofrankia inefficax]|uniref:AraC family transcriptional regulator n=1 Tax=Pseudofrankia inefficax (strain DSM 45817 / CECT 9037 / DDB 130130 / EuI1c) TaxID=298654 RepID=E3IX45_PSEI1|nr:hypothetical protein [Pseudofrankia inefficax]ADP83817.1 AraC family transcriptional regulator [Pseudofrankia inefficax]
MSADDARDSAAVRGHQANLTYQLAGAMTGVEKAAGCCAEAVWAQQQLADYEAANDDVRVLLTEARELLAGLGRAGTLLRAAAALHAADVAETTHADLAVPVSAPAS